MNTTLETRTTGTSMTGDPAYQAYRILDSLEQSVVFQILFCFLK